MSRTLGEYTRYSLSPPQIQTCHRSKVVAGHQGAAESMSHQPRRNTTRVPEQDFQCKPKLLCVLLVSSRDFLRLLLFFLPLSTISSTRDVHRDPLIRLCRFLTRPTGLLIGGCRVSATALTLSRCFSFQTRQFFLAFSCGSRVYPPPMFSLLRWTLRLTFLACRSTIASAMSEKPRSRTRGPPACV